MLRSLTFLIRNPSGYSAQQAAADYHARTDTILVRVRIEFSATYGFLEAGNDAKSASAEKGIKIRQEDFWKAFRVGLSQKDDWIDPLSLDGEATYSDNGMDRRAHLARLRCARPRLRTAAVEVFYPGRPARRHYFSTCPLSGKPALSPAVFPA